MKKVFKMQNLDCANCAAKMERNISAIEGVTECSVNFIMQKATVVFSDGLDPAELLEKVRAACKRVDRDCEVIG